MVVRPSKAGKIAVSYCQVLFTSLSVGYIRAMKEMQMKRSFGRTLQSIRGKRGLTQDELAELVECSPEYISRTERGLSSPSFDMIAKLASALMVAPRDLFDFDTTREVNGK